MNQNNKNEYEIIDSHNSTYRFNTHTDCTKYPFTNNPNQPLQNMNYKDWITMDQHNQYYSGGPIPFETDIGTAVSAGIIVAGTMLAAVSAPFAIIAVGGAIVGAIIISIGTLLPIFWPNGEKDKTVWTEFIKMGENYVDTPLTETVKEDKLATLEGIRLVLAEYEKGFQDWKDLKEKQIPGSKPSQALQQASLTVKTRFEIVNNDILREMPGFQLPTYKMILLPIYAQVANLHLTLLQQGIEFADIWNADIFPSQTEFETNAGTSNDYYKDLIKKIQEYSNYCANTYREGLNNLKNEATMTWGILNSYRKEMTLTVLDIIAMFPFFDPKKYRVLIGTKNAVIGTKSELTREIYMDTHLEDKYERYFQLDKTEEVLIRKPHLFTWLSGINFETLIVNPSIPSLIGHQVDDVKTPTLLNPIETNSYDLWDHCIKVEGRCSETKSEKINFLYPTNIFKLTLDVYAKGSDDPTSATTLTINKIYFCDQNESIPPYIYNAGNTSKHIEKRNAVLENHYLSCITSYYPLKTSTFNNSTMQTIDMEEMKRYTLVWTHDSADPDNKIYKDTTTSLPVVKAYEINLPSKVIEGPGHTGGDVIQLQPQGSFKMTCRTASAEQKYFIRIRYASNGWVTAKPMINLIITQVESLVMQLNQTFAHTNYQELQYQEFGYLEFPNEVTLPANETINLIFNRLDSFSDSAVIIDKVEFLPITSSLQESREREKIEFAQMKVSSFFTNHTKNILQADVTDYE
ncbi:insecticidal delta-endotoxin Cry8Ea1 family protein, partial [Bacillus thuringiensis]|uniref:insecticidal delta-endotoxin Cry8Ea1 family protein n=1 Tax=Bacillus thuringiensis TaxID=1428 RepID=UPI003CED9331